MRQYARQQHATVRTPDFAPLSRLLYIFVMEREQETAKTAEFMKLPEPHGNPFCVHSRNHQLRSQREQQHTAHALVTMAGRGGGYGGGGFHDRGGFGGGGRGYGGGGRGYGGER